MGKTYSESAFEGRCRIFFEGGDLLGLTNRSTFFENVVLGAKWLNRVADDSDLLASSLLDPAVKFVMFF